MPSPVRPSDFCSLTPTPSISACESIKRVFFTIPQKICELLQYMFDESGNPTEEFLADVQTIPSGVMLDFAGLSAPAGWLICDGREVSRTEYPGLFAVIGTLWGSGDGVTTFNLPDFKDRVSVGQSTTKPFGSSGGSADIPVPEHRHGVGRFQGGNDNAWFFVDPFTMPETRDTLFIRGDGASDVKGSEAEGTEFGDQNATRPGILTTPPIDSTDLAGQNYPPYIVTTKIIKI